MASTDEESFSLDSEVRGHHVYKSAWTPEIGQLLLVQAEVSNTEDPYAMATIHHGETVGHMPRKIARTSFYFLQHGGGINCKITGRRRCSEVQDKGLVVPCTYSFFGSPKLIKRLIKEMCTKKLRQNH